MSAVLEWAETIAFLPSADSACGFSTRVPLFWLLLLCSSCIKFKASALSSPARWLKKIVVHGVRSFSKRVPLFLSSLLCSGHIMSCLHFHRKCVRFGLCKGRLVIIPPSLQGGIAPECAFWSSSVPVKGVAPEVAFSPTVALLRERSASAVVRVCAVAPRCRKRAASAVKSRVRVFAVAPRCRKRLASAVVHVSAVAPRCRKRRLLKSRVRVSANGCFGSLVASTRGAATREVARTRGRRKGKKNSTSLFAMSGGCSAPKPPPHVRSTLGYEDTTLSR
jgi:hypothetical protein